MNEPYESTGNLMHDLLATGLPHPAARLLEKAGVELVSLEMNGQDMQERGVGEIDAKHQSARIAIVGHGGSGAAALAQSMLARIKESGLEDVFVIDSVSRDVSHNYTSRRRDDSHFRHEGEALSLYPVRKQPKVKVAKPAEERTQADLDAIENARLKRERRAAKRRGNK